MDIKQAITNRRSIKEFTQRVVSRQEIEALIDLPLVAPNHRLTQPLRFHVLGPATRRAFGEILGARKAKKLTDEAAARATIARVGEDEAAIPAVIAISVALDENPEIREEDYATAMMAAQNIMLGAMSLGLGTHIRTGAVMDDSRTRELLAIPEARRVVAMIRLGEPAAAPEAKPRPTVADSTAWLD